MLDRLAAIGRIAMKDPAQTSLGDVLAACEIVREVLAAEEAYVLRAGDPHLIKLGSDENPKAYDVKQKGYWVIWKELASQPALPLGAFMTSDRIVHDALPLTAAMACGHIASILPSDQSNAEMLVVRGPWEHGVSPIQIEFLEAVRPALARIVANLIDVDQLARQLEQFRSLSELSNAFSRAEHMDNVLTSLATALSRTSGIEWVNISVVDEPMERVVDAASNVNRHSEMGAAREWQETRLRSKRTADLVRQLAADGKAKLVPDIFDPVNGLVSDEGVRMYYERAHILSVASFPILFQNEVLGVISFSAARHHDFAEEELAFLTQLVAEASVTVKGLCLQRDLREAEQRLRSVLSAAPISLFALDADGLFTFYTGNGRRSGPDRTGESILGLYEDLAEPTEKVQAALNGEPGTFVVETDGLVQETQLTPIKNEAGWVTSVIGVATDITERWRAQAELRTLNDQLKVSTERALELAKQAEASAQAKSEFLANTSHEIRTPMNGVIGMTDLLMQTSLDEEQVEFVETIRDSAEALMTVINDILDFSKLEAKKMTIDVIDFDLRSVVEDVADLLAPAAHRKGLEFIHSMAPIAFPSRLRGDPGRLRQVLINLVGNAIKFTSAGDIGISAEVLRDDEASALIRLSVTDTGIGIPADRLKAIFESFTQADGSSTRHFGGTGLGLSISKQLVELMGGRIGVSSDAGAGSTFWLEVPFVKQLNSAEAPVPPESIRGAEILIVDDNVTNRRILREQVQSWSCVAAEASGAAEALTMLASEPARFALILMDLQMPGMDGETATAAIKADARTASLPVVLLSSAGPMRLADAQAKGFAVALTKPVRQSQLFNTILEVLGAHDSRRPARGPRALPPPVEDVDLGLRVLLAEDNAINRKVAVRMLERWHCEIVTVGDGNAAAQALRDGHYDLVLMDCHMPEMDGYEATAAIRADEARSGKRVPIIAMTANALEGDRTRCLDAGMDDYVSKPVKPAELLKTLNRWAA